MDIDIDIDIDQWIGINFKINGHFSDDRKEKNTLE
jgi:hypothetical protein